LPFNLENAEEMAKKQEKKVEKVEVDLRESKYSTHETQLGLVSDEESA
jgi:hypothetical protein